MARAPAVALTLGKRVPILPSDVAGGSVREPKLPGAKVAPTPVDVGRGEPVLVPTLPVIPGKVGWVVREPIPPPVNVVGLGVGEMVGRGEAVRVPTLPIVLGNGL